MLELKLFTVSILPVILIALYIYNKDVNKEPTKLLLSLFVGGVLSTLISIMVSLVFDLCLFLAFRIVINETTIIGKFLTAFISVALIEEFSKWIITYKLSYKSIEFDEIYDMVVYSTFVSLGFACFENLLYVNSIASIFTGIIRGILSVPVHACCGVFMGYYLGLSKYNFIKKDYKYTRIFKILSLVFPILLHGFFDFCLFLDNIVLFIVVLVFTILLYIFSIKKVLKISKNNITFKLIPTICPNCGNIVKTNYCINCGTKNSNN